jgi:DNA-binding transcriptional LysR family regulator
MQSMNNLQIKYFLGIVNNGCNFTKAANTLYVSQSSLSQHIASLGKELGVKLFDSSNKSAIKLTPGGRLLYHFFTEYHEKLAESVIRAKMLNDMPTGNLKIACAIGLEMVDILKKIDDFLAKYPNIDVQIDSIERRQAENGLKENYYDLIITTLTKIKDEINYNWKLLFESQSILLYSAKHKLAAKSDLQIRDFKNEAFYILAEESLDSRIAQQKYCEDNGFTPKFKELPNVDSVFLTVETGIGCSILNKHMRICNNIAYKWIELDMSISFGFIWKKSNINPFLLRFLEEYFENSHYTSTIGGG